MRPCPSGVIPGQESGAIECLTRQNVHAYLQDMMAANKAGAGTRDALRKSNPLAIKVALLSLFHALPVPYVL